MESLLSDFSTAYVINLPERKDRLKSVTQALARIGWSLGAGGVQIYPAQKFAEREQFPNAGCRGLFFSHLACLRDAQRRGERNVLLLEDDVTFTSSLPRLTPSILGQLKRMEWDFCYLGHEQTGDIGLANSKTKVVKLMPYSGHILQSHFILINGRVVSRLIAHLDRVAAGIEGDQEYGPMPIDGAYNVFRRRPDVHTVIADPKLGWQRPSRSDITPTALDRWIPIKSLTSAIRHLRYVASEWRS